MTLTSRMNVDFPDCPICATQNWTQIYRGPVRKGGVGQTMISNVAQCSTCGLQRLAESACLQDSDYQSQTYRQMLGQSHHLEEHFSIHDELVRFTLDVIWPKSLRGLAVADVGCGGGAFLDHIKGVVGSVIAIDPDTSFRSSLMARGYEVFPSVAAAESWKGKIECAFSLQVIEHVENPVSFLRDILALLKPGGWLIVSTPNRDDILMSLLPEDFPAFFYRTQHRWMFDMGCLVKTGERAGFSLNSKRFCHRYGLENTLHWLRDRKPAGRKPMAGIDRHVSNLWSSWLESTGQADNLYAVFERPVDCL